MKKNNTPKRIRIGIAAIVFILIVLAFLGLFTPATALLKIQAAPSLMKTIAAFSVGTLVTFIVILLVTLLFGRFYCSIICPLGISQDIVAFLSRRKGKPLPKHLAFPRALCLGIVVGLLAVGWTLGFKLLDPYSNFGRVFASYGVGAILPFVIILALSVWRKRLFCNAICPVGTTLGIVSRIGLLKLSISEKCVKCGRCVKACNAGCIDLENHRIDNARCVRCLNCLGACAMGAIHFGRPIAVQPPAPQEDAKPADEQPTPPPSTPDMAKRELLLSVPVGLVGLGVSAAVGKHFLKALLDAKTAEPVEEEADEAAEAKPQFILPPGAGDVSRFASKCTACLLCVHNCPSKIIKPSPTGYGFVTLNLEGSHCGYDCNRCSQICPTGAIQPISLADKQKLRIAQATINYKNCKVYQDEEPCGKCAEVCPTKAITLIKKTGAPKLKKSLCIGCGACQAICPNKTITVSPIPQQEGVEVE